MSRTAFDLYEGGCFLDRYGTREEAEEMKARLIEAGDDPTELSIEAVRIGRGF